MTLLRIISVLALGWLAYAGLRNFYYGEYLSAGVKLGFGLLLVALFAGIRLIRNGRRLAAYGDAQRGRQRVLFGSLTLLGVFLGGIVWLIFFVGARLQYGPTQAPWLANLLAPRLSARLAFASHGDIYVLNSDGSRKLLSPKKQRRYYRPAWFSDGDRLLVGTTPDDRGDLYVMNADGSTITLAENQSRYWTLHEDPLFLVSEEDGNKEIYVKNSQDSQPVRLTHNDATDGSPRPSPDGRRVAFVSDRDGNREIYVMNADGSNLIRLTNDPEVDMDPQWSPDGGRIAFLSKRDGWAIYVIPAEGGRPMRVTKEPNVRFFQWSPDGQQIAYVVLQNLFEQACSAIVCQEIYVANSDGSKQTRLTRTRASNRAPIWSPDGRHIAFLSDRQAAGNPQTDIYVMNADGSRQTRLTFDEQQFDPPVWAPH